MRLERLGIQSEGVTLAALRYLPDRAERDTALLYIHGFTSGKYSMDSLAGYLAGRGYEGLSFDLIGHKLGASGGAMRRADQAVLNAIDAADWLRRHTRARRIVFVGHSMGGMAALCAAARERQRNPDPAVALLAGAVCLCIGVDPARGFEGAIGQAMLAQRRDYVEGAPAQQLLMELDGLVEEARDVGDLPMLFLAARQDVLIPPERVAALAALAGPTADFEILETSHLEAPDRSRIAVVRWLEAQKL